MKTGESDRFAANVAQYLRDSLSEDIVITQEGRPCTIVHGLHYDDKQIELANSPEFWSMIEERRRGPTIPWELAKQQLNSLDLEFDLIFPRVEQPARDNPLFSDTFARCWKFGQFALPHNSRTFDQLRSKLGFGPSIS